MQEELNWLGTRGKDGGKGGKGARKGKGKGKGKTGKGKGSEKCGWFDKPGHWKKDCKELAKWKDERDAERKKNGQPPFVPRLRPAYSLEPEIAVPPFCPPFCAHL